MDATLDRYRPPILIEVLPYTQEAGDASGPALAVAANRKRRTEELTALLRAKSYMAFRLGDRVLQPVQDFDLPAYDELLVNYLLVPQERVGEFADLMERRPVPAPAAVLA